ncbi:MAG: hypothetical protein U0271_08935 [Polyangiaceae bacterium]
MAALASLGLVGLGLVACKPDIPKEYDDIIPQKDLRKFLPREKSALEGGGGSGFYKTTDKKALTAAFREKITAAGYKEMMKCEDADLVVAVKGDNTVVDVNFLVMSEETMANVTKAKMSMVGFPEKAKCEWTDAAKAVCEVQGDHCYFREK